MKPDENCGTCAHSRCKESQGAASTLECHANAPRPRMLGERGYGERAYATEWPRVDVSEPSCGDYEPIATHTSSNAVGFNGARPPMGLDAKLDAARVLLVNLQMCGGLGFEVHAEIERVLEVIAS